ncbi:phytanoyl-CoA dioxygenase family protein [Kordiimonas aquimaris]|uniref:phytanoyl-CoA dioxygenase family protein n=1 Tax=Kordiimonas aquimaris TaxID=707591 RepID=UPI0021D33038|nr:phytanoyl-CoA dioxygenase family protein [Kordiimonas aquimaris]
MPKPKYRIIKFWMWPIWILALLTTAKSFKDNPVIGAKLLNRLGLHISRVFIARGITWLRWWLLSPLLKRSYRKDFHTNGFVIIPDFLDTSVVQAIREEIKTHARETRAMTQGNTDTQRILLDTSALHGKPMLKNLCYSNALINALRYGAATFSIPLLYVQRIRNGFHAGKQDPQKTMHADTFHPTMKAWLFLEDVTPEKGPFTYVPGSQRLTTKRIKWEYQRSCSAASNPDGYSEKGSFRASAEDLKAMGLPDSTGVCVSAGTLVIANTNGFHGRGMAESGSSRLEIWAYNRPNPFNPFPGLPFRFVAHLKNHALKTFWRRKDKVAKHKGSKSSWHLIKASEMTDFDA